MSKRQKTFYRKDPAEYALVSEKLVKQISEELELNYKTFCNWVNKRK